MFTLVNIILHINSVSLPQVNVVTNFNNRILCEQKFDETLARIKGKNKKGSINVSQDGKKYLEITDIQNKLKSYWFCNEIIFYKK